MTTLLLVLGLLFSLVACVTAAPATAAAAGAATAVSAVPAGVSDSVIEAIQIWEDQRKPEAVRLLRAAAAAQPSALVEYLLGERLMGQEDWAGAAQAFRRATELDPNFARARFELTRLRVHHLEDISVVEARDAYEAIFRLRPQNETYAISYLDTLIWDQRFAARAEQAFSLVFSHLPNSVQLRLYQVLWLKAAGRLAEANRLVNRVVELATASNNAGTLKHTAHQLFEAGFIEPARVLARLALAHPDLEDWMLEYLRPILANN